MFTIKFAIWVQTAKGEKFIAFHWTRSAEAGIALALSEAKRFGHIIEACWAEPVEQELEG